MIYIIDYRIGLIVEDLYHRLYRIGLIVDDLYHRL